MALEHDYCLIASDGECIEATFLDKTLYGLLGNPERHTLAYKYLVYKVAVDGTRTLLTLNTPLPAVINISGQIDPSDYVGDKIIFPIDVDGWYELVLFNPAIWDNATNYIKETVLGNDQSIVYYAPTESFYYALEDNSNIAPDSGGGPANWQVIPDEDWENLISNTSLIYNVLHEDVVSCKTERKLGELTTKQADEIICGNCPTFKELEDLQILEILLNSMLANNFTDQQFKSEKIALNITNKYNL